MNRIFQNFHTFPTRDSFVIARGHFSVLETVDRVCVVISLRSNHKMTGLIACFVINKFANYI